MFKYAAYVSFSTFASESRPNTWLLAMVSASSAVLSKAFSGLQLIPDVFSPSRRFLLLPPPALAAEAGLLFSCVVLELVQAGRETSLLSAEMWGIAGACVSAVSVKVPDRALRFVLPPGAKSAQSSPSASAHCFHSRGEKDRKA